MNLLFEEIMGDSALVYHRGPDPNYHEYILEQKYKFNKGAGSMYGHGIYAVYDKRATEPKGE
jgi:hypothetical protein